MRNEQTIKRELKISVGQCSRTGAKERNEDCVGVFEPEPSLLLTKGFAGVIADGVSAASHGREAAAMCVHSFLTDYYSTPDTWSVKRSGQRVLNALNRWLYGQGQRQGVTEKKGYLSTHSSVVILSNTANVFHIGDTRVYRIRGKTIELLTHDHCTQVNRNTSYLSRAMGLGPSPRFDFKELEVELGDVFLLTSDGVHGWLLDQQLLELAASTDDLNAAAESMVEAALLSGSNDNLSAMLMRVDSLPSANQDELREFLKERPLPPRMYPGVVVDGLEVVEVLSERQQSVLYQVRDLSDGAYYVMKAPSAKRGSDPRVFERFAAELWISKRVEHPSLAKVVERNTKPSFLYYLMQELPDETLQGWLKKHQGDVPLQELVGIVSHLVSAVRSLHRKQIVHQNLSLEQIVIDQNLVPMISDYGSCKVESMKTQGAPGVSLIANENLGFSAPELRLNIASDVGPWSDQFSIAMIAYHILTGGRCPFGDAWDEAKSFRDFANLKYISVTEFRNDIPVWVDGALRRALKVDAESRYSSLSEFVTDLESENPQYAGLHQPSLLEKNPERFWQVLSFLLAVGLICALVF